MKRPPVSLLAPCLAVLCSCAAPQQDVLSSLDAIRAQQQADSEAVRAELAKLREEVAKLRAEQEGMRDDLVAARRPSLPPARPQRPGRPDPEVVYSVPVGDSPVWGPADAWVTMVVFTDFQCPFCGRAQLTVRGLRERYGDDLRVVFKHNPLPFHNQAMPAAKAALCAHQQKQFWPLHDLLFANQRELGDGRIEELAQGLQLGMKRWRRCLDDAETQKRIEQDQDLAARIGARGTPTFFINGRVLTGAQPSASFEALIDAELARAKKSGVPRGEYYQRRVVEGGEEKL